jgi:glutamine synthetase
MNVTLHSPAVCQPGHDTTRTTDPADWAVRFKAEGVRDVECLFADVTGYPRGKLMPAASFARGQELRICQAIPMQCVTGEYSTHPVFPDSDPDVRLVPDMATLRRVPWSSVPRYVAVHDCVDLAGQLSPFAARSTLKTVVARYHALGLRPVVAPEIEFYLTAAVTDPAQPLTVPVGRGGRAEVGQSAFSMNMLNELAPFWDEFHAALDQLGVRTDTWLHEMGQGQYEINLLHGDPVAAADQAFLFKYAAKEVALRHGLNAVFMAKPMAGQAGSSMHLHQSVEDGPPARTSSAMPTARQASGLCTSLAACRPTRPTSCRCTRPTSTPTDATWRAARPR